MALENYKLINPWVSFEILGGPSGVTGADFRDALMDFKFKHAPGSQPKVEMQFDNSSGNLLNFAVLLIGLKLKVRFGYENLLSRPYIVPVKRVKGAAIGTMGRGLQSSRPDLYGAVTMTAPAYIDDEKHFQPKDAVWAPTSPMPLSRAVKQIARKYGYRETGIFVQEKLGIDTEKESLFSKDQILEDETVEEFLYRKAKERGFKFWWDNKEFHWHGDDWKIKPHDTITYFEGPDLLDFEIEGDYNLNLTRVKSKGLNPKTGQLVSTVIDRGGKPVGIGGSPLRRGADPKSVQSSEIVTSISKKSAESAVGRMMRQVLNRWKVKMTLVGNPTIFIGSALNLVNFGPVIDGVWYVREVEHVINQQGYTTIVKARGRKRLKQGPVKLSVVYDTNGSLRGVGAARSGYAVRSESKRRRPRKRIR